MRIYFILFYLNLIDRISTKLLRFIAIVVPRVLLGNDDGTEDNEMYRPPQSQRGVQRFDNYGKANSVPNRYVDALDINGSYTENEGTVDDGVSCTFNFNISINDPF